MTYSSVASVVCSLVLAGSALAQADVQDNAQSLLEKVKRRDLERQMATMQTGLDRLAEDIAKGRKDAETMRANVDATGNLLKESGAHLTQLAAQKKRLEQVLDLTSLRIEAERLKSDGLQMLADAQAKALAALNKRAEETEVRASLGRAELNLIGPNPADQTADAPAKEPSAKGKPTVSELRKKLAACEAASASAEKIAHDAMKAATSKLELADIASTKARRKASTVEGDLPEIAEKPLDLEEKAAEKAHEKPALIAPPK